jgi:AmmeMemoRadiSam system protein A
MNDNEIYSKEEKELLLSYARKTMEAALKNESQPEALPEKFDKDGSCFVTLHTKDGNLRGCIGSLQAYEPLSKNIASNAINAAFRDPRFPGVSSLEELSKLELEISIMTQPKPIPSPEEFIVGKHGIIMRANGRSAVFLPQVAPEQGWDRETTLKHLSMKAGLPQDAWKSADAEFSVFEAIVFSEKEILEDGKC